MNDLTVRAAGLGVDRFRLDDRVVVTGGSPGLGIAFARACADAGADLVAVARRAERPEDTTGSELVVDEGFRLR